MFIIFGFERGVDAAARARRRGGRAAADPARMESAAAGSLGLLGDYDAQTSPFGRAFLALARRT
jgi:hypothetical protein